MLKRILKRIHNIRTKPCAWCGDKSVSTRTPRMRTPTGWITTRTLPACALHLIGDDTLPPAQK